MLKSPLKHLHNATYFDDCTVLIQIVSNVFQFLRHWTVLSNPWINLNSWSVCQLILINWLQILANGKPPLLTILVKKAPPSDIFTHTSFHSPVTVGLRKTGISGWFSVNFALGSFLQRCMFGGCLYLYVALFCSFGPTSPFRKMCFVTLVSWEELCDSTLDSE